MIDSQKFWMENPKIVALLVIVDLIMKWNISTKKWSTGVEALIGKIGKKNNGSS